MSVLVFVTITVGEEYWSGSYDVREVRYDIVVDSWGTWPRLLRKKLFAFHAHVEVDWRLENGQFFSPKNEMFGTFGRTTFVSDEVRTCSLSEQIGFLVSGRETLGICFSFSRRLTDSQVYARLGGSPGDRLCPMSYRENNGGVISLHTKLCVIKKCFSGMYWFQPFSVYSCTLPYLGLRTLVDG